MFQLNEDALNAIFNCVQLWPQQTPLTTPSMTSHQSTYAITGMLSIPQRQQVPLDFPINSLQQQSFRPEQPNKNVPRRLLLPLLRSAFTSRFPQRQNRRK
jgi:hypothetical protein